MSGASHFLFVGDHRDVELISRILATLPDTSYGQVFIEVPSNQCMVPIAAPQGMTVHWLLNSPQDSLVPPGGRALEALNAWAVEWMADHLTGHDLPYLMWVGCHGNLGVSERCRDLSAVNGELHLHHPHFH